MTDERLYHLFKLHEVDEKLLSIKGRAENLDLGKKELAGIKKIRADYASDLELFELKKKEIEQERLKVDIATQKIKKFNEDLYSGNALNSKEVENLQKEIQMLEQLGLTSEQKIEDLQIELEPLSKRVNKINAKIRELEETAKQKRIQAELEHEQLKAAFKDVGATRHDRESAVEPELIKVYDAARKRTGNTGVALVTPENRCSGCGVPVPERTRDAVRIGKTQQCESCRRVLFIREEAIES